MNEINPYRPPPANNDPPDDAQRPERSNTHVAVVVWLCVAATIAYICRNSIGVAESTIRRDLGISEVMMGYVMGVAFFGFYALAQTPSGYLADRWGTRRALPLFALLWSVATAAMAFAFSGWALIITRMANGIAQAGLFPGAANTFSHWTPQSRRGIASGSLGGFMSIGGAIGIFVTGWLLEKGGMSWRTIFAMYSLLGIAWGAGFYWWFRDTPREHPGVSLDELALIEGHSDVSKDKDNASEAKETNDSAAPNETSAAQTGWLLLLTSPAMWAICGQQFFRAAGQIFFASWFATYLQETRGVGVAQSGFLTMLPLLSLFVGSLSGGVLTDWLLKRTGRRRIARSFLAAGAMFLCGGCALGAYFVEDANLAVAIICLGSFCAAIGGPCAYAVTIDMGGPRVASSFSVMNMMGNFGAAAFPSVAALLKQATGSWHAVLLLFAGMYLAAGVCWLLLRPEGTIFDQSLLRSSGGDAS